MESLSSRLKSFSKAKPSKSSSKSNSLAWPHPDNFAATPSTLADAGFYFNPSLDDPDSVKCFLCDKELSSWEADDDPFNIHTEKSPKCPWAAARCSLEYDCDSSGRFAFKDASRLPNNKTLEKARLDTFGGKRKWWPHDAVKSHGATSKKLAKAGFVYTPQESSVQDDTATCFYCELSLSGWDPEDDPTAEHLKREERSGKQCPFFDPEVSKPSLSKSVNGTKKSKSAAKKPAVGDSDNDKQNPRPPSAGPSGKPVKQKAPTKSKSKAAEGKSEKPITVKKSTKPTKASSRKQSTKPTPISDDDGDGDEPEHSQTRRPPSRQAEVDPPAKKKGRKEATMVDKSNGIDEDRPRGRSQRATIQKPPSNVDQKSTKEYQDLVVPMDDDSDTKKRPKKDPDSKSTSRARSKSKSRGAESRPSSRASTKSHTRSQSKTTVTLDVDVPQADVVTAEVEMGQDDESGGQREDLMEVDTIAPPAAVPAPLPASHPPRPDPPQSANTSYQPTRLPSPAPENRRPPSPKLVAEERPRTPLQTNGVPKHNDLTEDLTPNDPPPLKLDFPTFLPPLAEFPMKPILELTADERAMTVEEYIRHQMTLQFESFRLDGQRRIDDFKRQAAETRVQIEAL